MIAAALAVFAVPALAATPAELEVVAREQGVWDAEITFPSQEPGKPDGHAKGVQENELRSGGMWMLNRFSVDGTPYQGTGVWGFDRVTGRYKGIWVDNNDQQIRFDDGRWDPETSTLTWTADVPQPDGRHLRMLTTEEFKGDKRVFRSVALTRKGEVPLVVIEFTRRNSGS
jgi:hypothetical protein